MKVIICEPKRKCEVREIGSKLEDLQAVVGGLIECVSPWEDNICLVCNEEGKIRNLPWNRLLRGANLQVLDIIAGTFFLCSTDDEGEFASLTDEQIEKYSAIMDRAMVP
jgi:hypothetical protein